MTQREQNIIGESLNVLFSKVSVLEDRTTGKSKRKPYCRRREVFEIEAA